jgi:hypothetical protein
MRGDEATFHLIEPFGFKLDDAQLNARGGSRMSEWRRWAGGPFEQLAFKALVH